MKSFEEQKQIVTDFHKLGETKKAAAFLLEEYELYDENFAGFEFREPAKPEYTVWFVTLGK